MGGIKDAFTSLGGAIERGIGVASEQTKKVAHNAYDVTIGQSQRENAYLDRRHDMYDLYKKMKSEKVKSVHGMPATHAFNRMLNANGWSQEDFDMNVRVYYEKVGY